MKSLQSATALRPAWLIVVSSVWMATIANLPLWRELQTLALLQGPSGWALAAGLAGVIAGVLVALLSLCAWRFVLKPAILVLLATSAIGGYFMLSYHIVIDSSMLVNAWQTDRREAVALFNPRLLVAIGGGLLLPGWVVWRLPVRHAPWPRQALRNLGMASLSLLAVGAVALLCFQPLASAMRNHKQLRYLMNPLNTVYAAASTAVAPLRRPPGPARPLGTDARLDATASPRPALLVLVLGETGRAGHFGLNGYGRNTTPAMRAAGAATFTNVWSCGTSTAASVPCMFSHLGQAGYDGRDRDYENLLDVLTHAGLAVLWIDNQAGCKGVCERVATVNTSSLGDPDLCTGGQCQDGILVRGLDQRLAALPPAARAKGVVLVLHQMGSHGPAYWQRSPAATKRWLPECTSNNLQDCSREELVNAYDNSIAYTDQVLGSVVDWLKTRQGDYDTAMLYVADHGESLGENNLYLHGLPYGIAPDVQKHVPWITWLSAGYEARSGVAPDCLRTRSAARLTHDHYFHSVLGLLNVRTAAYRPALDAYAGCSAH